MGVLNEAAKQLLTAGRLAHLATVNEDGSPQLSVVWVGLEDEEIVIGHLMGGRKIMNIGRRPQVTLSMEAEGANDIGMANYLIVQGRARLSEGGAPELLQRLAHVYLGPEVRFPPFDNPPGGHVIRITPEKVGGTGPWSG